MAQHTEPRNPIGPDFTINDDYPQSTEARDPLSFPEPRLDPCVRITTRIYDPFTRDESMRYFTVSNCVLVPTRPDARTRRRLQSAHSSEIDWTPAPSSASGTSTLLNKQIVEEEDDASFCSSDSSTSSSSSSSIEDSMLDGDEDTMMDIDNSSGNPSHTRTATASQAQNSNSSDLAYWLQRSLRDAIYGRVMYAVVLKRRSSCVPSSHHNPSNPWAEWEVTSERVAVKELSWAKIRRERKTNNAEDPLKEVAAMQYMKRVHQRLHDPNNVDTENTSSSSMEAFLQAKELMIRTRLMMVLDVLSDEDFLYSIMPFCDGAELFDLLDNRERFTEGECRYWMHQILVGIESLQIAGVCHRDMSLENLMTDSSRRSMVIDMGMALRIHFHSDDNEIVEHGRNRDRYLIRCQTICGKWNYMSPEILENQGPFDGYAVDLWAVGVILFIMLTGFPPWEQACQRRDERFKFISNGYLQPLLRQWGIPVSGDAVDLLQRMLFLNPQDRLSLDQIRAHPWMQMPVELPP